MTRESGNKPQVYLFFGDEYLVREAVDALIGRTVGLEKRLTNVTVFDGTDLDVGALVDDLFTGSLFGGNRVTLLENATFLIGKSDEKTLAGKAVALWRAQDGKGALKTFAQLIAAAGVSAQEALDRDWIRDTLGGAGSTDDFQALSAVAQAFAESGVKVRGKADEGAILEIVARPLPEGVLFIMTATAVDKRKRLYKALESGGGVVECATPSDKSGAKPERSFFDDRVRKFLGSAGKSISGEALTLMHQRSGRDMRRLKAELEKLAAYLGDRNTVTAEDVRALFLDFHETVFFDLTEAMRKSDLAKTLRALHEQLAEGAHPLMLLGSVAAEIRRLMVARELLFREFKGSWKPSMEFAEFRGLLTRVRKESGTQTGKGSDKYKLNLLAMNDYRIHYYLKDAARFPMDRLIAMLEAALETDIAMKSWLGAAGSQALLADLAFKICVGAGRAPN